MKTFKGKNNEVLGTFLENTDVVVNPTLVGDEPEMTGIQVGGQKYKAPQGGGSGGGSTVCCVPSYLAFNSNLFKPYNTGEGVSFKVSKVIEYLEDKGFDLDEFVGATADFQMLVLPRIPVIVNVNPSAYPHADVIGFVNEHTMYNAMAQVYIRYNSGDHNFSAVGMCNNPSAETSVTVTSSPLTIRGILDALVAEETGILGTPGWFNGNDPFVMTNCITIKVNGRIENIVIDDIEQFCQDCFDPTETS